VAAVQLHVPEFVDAQQNDPSVPRDGLRQRLLVGGLDQFVGELGGQRVRDTEAGYRGLGAERDQEMGLAGAGVPDQAQRLTLLDLLALGQGVDDRGIDAGLALKSKLHVVSRVCDCVDTGSMPSVLVTAASWDRA
jgi:hypothetical protein